MNRRDRLQDTDITERLDQLDGWTLDDGRLHRRFEFHDFVAAFGFMASVALVAERLNHHPDWSNTYKTVVVHLSSHDVGGLSGRHFELAGEIDAIAARIR